MVDAQAIVALLNEASPDCPVSLMDFCQKSPQQLQELLMYVLSFIQPIQKDIDIDSPNASTSWVLDLLRMLNYHPPFDRGSFHHGLLFGSTIVIYPLLFWLLSEMSMLKKRVYLAQFLTDLEIPREFMMDEDLNYLQGQCDSLGEQFKTTHYHLECLHKDEKYPALLKENVPKLEAEREHLTSKISKIKTKIQNVPKLDEILAQICFLRVKADEEANLQRAIQEQSEALKNISVRHRRTMLTIGQLQDFVNVSSSSMLEKFSQECSLLHYITKKKLPKELETKGFHFQALSDVLFDTSNMELKIPCIQAKLVAVNDSLKQLNMQTDNDGNCFNDAVVGNGKALYWEQAQMRGIISDKMRSLSANMDSLNGCKNRLMVELTSKYRAIEEVAAK